MICEVRCRGAASIGPVPARLLPAGPEPRGPVRLACRRARKANGARPAGRAPVDCVAEANLAAEANLVAGANSVVLQRDRPFTSGSLGDSSPWFSMGAAAGAVSAGATGVGVASVVGAGVTGVAGASAAGVVTTTGLVSCTRATSRVSGSLSKSVVSRNTPSTRAAASAAHFSQDEAGAVTIDTLDARHFGVAVVGAGGCRAARGRDNSDR